jgi:hypothetical protein
MDFSLIRQNVKSLKLQELRTDCDNYFEAVLVKEELDSLYNRLKESLGEPVFPSKGRLDFRMEQAVKGYGGILPGQTLYYRSRGENTVFAMIWPWQDGKHTTLKIIQK